MNRDLRFQNLNDALEELDRLENARVNTTGLWSFYQILNHCAELIEFSMTEYPYAGFFAFLVRKLYGKIALQKMIKNGYMKSGYPNPFAPKRREEGDVKQAARRLRNAIFSFRDFSGTFAVHPIFDRMEKETWEKLHAMHIANHFGFVHVVETLEKDERSQKVDKIKEELLKNMSHKLLDEEEKSLPKEENQAVPAMEPKPEELENKETEVSSTEEKPESITEETIENEEKEEVQIEKVEMEPQEDESISRPSLEPEAKRPVQKKKTQTKKKATISKKKTIKKKVPTKKKVASKKKVVSKKKATKKKTT
ncbi:MAG: DUF1569 domain-containing protein [Leptospiraceae bacterium]|nr:DUF1569 domain-containing protein [Leptospiraceae bacterium]MCP5502275.1 DUF1569 domain-containing protein [Leptospiraceae bacterium]